MIASSGQTEAHKPHPRHRFLSTTATSSTVIASTGQRSIHVPQPMHNSISNNKIVLNIVICDKKTYEDVIS